MGSVLNSVRVEVQLVGVLLPSDEEWAVMRPKGVLA